MFDRLVAVIVVLTFEEASSEWRIRCVREDDGEACLISNQEFASSQAIGLKDGK